MQKYISYEIKIEHPFLLIPVKIKEETERLSFYLEDQKRDCGLLCSGSCCVVDRENHPPGGKLSGGILCKDEAG